MKHVRLRFSAKLAVVLVAALPLAAQDGTDILTTIARPPLQRFINPNASPDAGPTGYFPGKIRVAYGFNSITNKGVGQTIAIVDAYDDPNVEADLGTFDTEFKLSACTTANGCFTKIFQTGTTPPADTSGWSNEIAIDTQWAHAIAPGAKIVLVEANSSSLSDLLASVEVAVKNGASVVSMSWSGGESKNETSTDAYFEAKGVTFVAASGDTGHGVGYPAASPFVVAVGGTSLTINSSTGAWVSETAWSGSSGGESAYETEPAYQMGVQTSGKRGVPDVAYDGNPNTGIPAYNSFACSGACYTGWDQWGGTSIGTPQWAALFAITDAERHAAGKAKLTQPQVDLYPDAEADYHDIVSGTNGSCGTLCTAGPGYDFVTGLGSPQANLLIPALVAAK
jgi:subtilase family serine protease